MEEEWSEIVDKPLTRNLKVGSFENGHLLLLASDPSWSQEASYRTKEIRTAINEHFEHELVESIRVKH